MKNLLKKSAVATAVAGSLMISSMVSADSVLAPLVIGLDGGANNAGVQTYFSIKARGAGTVNARMASTTDLHYVWFKKNTGANAGAGAGALLDLNQPCEVSNNNGRVSPWDMVFQRAVGSVSNNTPTAQMNLLGETAPGANDALDASRPNGYTAGDFVGFVVITDKANVNSNPAVKDLANEGELSGFGYVVDPTNNLVLDYKLLNNHRSKVEGDFSAGFIAKKSVDFSWFPQQMAFTQWLAVATGEDMLKADSGAGAYDATVLFSQDTAAGSVSPQLPTGGSGVYNNDEVVTSGGVNARVTCMGVLNKDNIMSTLQLADTINGGWKRMSIQNSATRTVVNNGVPATVNTTQVASGAIVYKAEMLSFVTTNLGGFVSPEVTRAMAPGLAAVASVSTGGIFGTKSGTTYVPSPGLAPSTMIKASDAESYDPGVGVAPYNFVVSFQPETSGHLSSSPEPHPNRPY